MNTGKPAGFLTDCGLSKGLLLIGLSHLLFMKSHYAAVYRNTLIIRTGKSDDVAHTLLT